MKLYDIIVRPTFLGLLLTISLSAGCLPINHFSCDGGFAGLSANAAETGRAGGSLRVLVIHGMGVHHEGYSCPLVSGLVSRLHLRPSGPSDRVEIREGFRFYGAINTQSFTDGIRRMVVYELTWSPITEWIKDFQFGSDMREFQHRQIINHELKQSLLDLSFSDAVLYAGKFRPQMQYPIEVAVKKILNDGIAASDQLAIITSSLGSYMLFDTLVRMSSEGHGTDSLLQKDSSEQFAAHTTQIFMLANQLPLLELSDLEPQSAKRPENVAGASTVLKHFLELKKNASSKSFSLQLSKIQIVAFSDPNDLLSFTLNKSSFSLDPPGTSVSAVNVSKTIERWSVLGVVADPFVAHTGWDTDSRALDLLTFGYSGQATPARDNRPN